MGANWRSSPYVHFVEVDFVPGILHDNREIFGEMWGGFALALMLQEKRVKDLEIWASHEFHFQTVLSQSAYSPFPSEEMPLDYRIAIQLLIRVRNMKMVQRVLKSESIRKLLRNALLRIQRLL